MNNEDFKSIYEFDLNLIGDFFKDLPRQGPGNDEITRLALTMIPDLPADARMADLGAGTGGQTIALARNTSGHITAIELMPAFIDIMKRRVADAGLSERITVHEGSMDDLPFERESLDLIWCEGAIYNIGYESGLKLWYDYLKPGGYVAVTEATWFTPDPHPEIVEFWNEAGYPDIDTIPVKVRQMADIGYLPHAHFALPEKAWWDYFAPMPENRKKFLARNPANPAAGMFARSNDTEIGLYTRYRADYGYAFYIGRKPML